MRSKGGLLKPARLLAACPSGLLPFFSCSSEKHGCFFTVTSRQLFHYAHIYTHTHTIRQITGKNLFTRVHFRGLPVFRAALLHNSSESSHFSRLENA
uniref:Putative secreted protein n=1 Tax=Anopheles triannulatus TaxID=58253 RepID=A0A2M4B3T8_9DIPT